MPFSSGERILIFLHTSRPPDGLSAGFDQEILARECGIGRTHVPRSLKPLLDQGLVNEDKGRSPGKVRRVKRYSLSSRGQEAAAGIMERVAVTRLSLIGPDGVKHTMDPISILSLVNAHLSSSLAVVSLPVLLSVESDTVEWERLLEVIADNGPEDEVFLPKGWKAIAPPKMPEGYVPRPEEAELARLLAGSEIVIVEGPSGSGRRTMLSKVLGAQKARTLWVRRAEGSPPSRVTGGADVLVIVDDRPPDPARLLMGGGEGSSEDPRNEDWEEPLRSLPLVMISSPWQGRNGPVVRMSSLDIRAFASAVSDLGIAEEALMRIHRATGGSPLAIAALRSMGPDEISDLSGQGRDEPLFRLLVRLERSKDGSKD